MPGLHLQLLGGFEARLSSGQPLDIAAKKARALLAYLALPTGRPHSRDKLVGLLWSDRSDEQARNSLRQALAELARALAAVEPSPLVRGRDTLALDAGAVEVDALLLERLATSDDVGDLRRAAALYVADLLDGFDARDSAFEEWLRAERQRMRDLATTVLKKLLANEIGRSAFTSAQRLLAIDPLQEEGHRALMRLHAEAGETGAALRQYELCRDMLKRDLDAAPAPETEALYIEIRQRPGTSAAPPVDHKPLAPTHEGQPDATPSSKPTIAVLPFENKSGDPEQQYFSDGITADLITELSRFRLLTVIGSHSSFAFRGQSLDIAETGRRLGAEYVVDGSIWRAGDKLRVAARLFDSRSGSQLWAERYDRSLEDIFAVRDDVVQAIVAALPHWIMDAGWQSARRKRPENLVAYDYLLRGFAHILTLDRAEARQAEEMFQQAVAIDPGLALGYVGLAISCLRSTPRDTSGRALDEALKLARQAVALDDNDAWCHLALGEACLYHRQLDDAAFHFQRAVALNPNDAAGAVYMGVFAAYLGRLDEATLWMEKAFRLNPYAPPWYSMWNGMVMYSAQRYADAVVALNRVFKPDPWEVMYLAASYAQLGRRPEARAMLAEFQSLRPDTSVLRFATSEPFKNPADLEHLLDGLRKAELPE